MPLLLLLLFLFLAKIRIHIYVEIKRKEPVCFEKVVIFDMKILLLRVKNVYTCAVNEKFSHIKDLNLVISNKKEQMFGYSKKTFIHKLRFHENFLTNKV